MRVNEARAPRFRHGLVLHDGPADALALLLPVASAVRERGGILALDLSEEVAGGLRERLGTDGITSLTPLTRAARESAQTVAAWRARELRALTSGEREILVLAEHDPDLDGPDGTYWTEYEAALNISLGGLPMTQVCAYPQLPLHRVVADAAVANHAFLLQGAELVGQPGAPRYRPRYFAACRSRRRTCSGRRTSSCATTRSSSAACAGRWRTRCADSRLDAERAEDMVLAVNEIATNAVEHGSAQAELFVWASDDELVCELHDEGDLALPLIGLAPPHPSQPRGRGTWIARQLCDALHVWHDDSGTHVRLLAHA